MTSSTPDVPDAPGIEREEGESSPVQPNGELAVAVSRKAGTASGTGGEEDWTSMAAGDPAFWLKD